MNVKNIFQTTARQYAAPVVDRIDISVEKGFAASYGQPGGAGDKTGNGGIFEF